MAGAKRDDLVLVNRDGKDYQSTVASINLPISEHPELGGEPKPWDDREVVWHVLNGEKLYISVLKWSQRPNFVAWNAETEEVITPTIEMVAGKNHSLTYKAPPTPLNPANRYDLAEAGKELMEREDVPDSPKTLDDNDGEQTTFGYYYYYYYVPIIPDSYAVALPPGEWIISPESLDFNDQIKFYAGEDFELGPETRTDKVCAMCLLFQGTKFSNMGKPLPKGFKTDNCNDLRYTFRGLKEFTQPLDQLNVSKVLSFAYMFEECEAFNQPLNSWKINTSSEIDLSYMFNEASIFDQPLDNWDTSNVVDMAYLFASTEFNSPTINEWDTSKVKSMLGMFRSGIFNQPLDKWTTKSVTNYKFMFHMNKAFNQDIGHWIICEGDVSEYPVEDDEKVNMYSMFRVAEAFNNGDSDSIKNWNTAKVWDMQSMFTGAISFNQPIASWVTTNVCTATGMRGVFDGAKSFCQDLSDWCIMHYRTQGDRDYFSRNSGMPEDKSYDPDWSRYDSCPRPEDQRVQ